MKGVPRFARSTENLGVIRFSAFLDDFISHRDARQPIVLVVRGSWQIPNRLNLYSNACGLGFIPMQCTTHTVIPQTGVL